jgi:hypothetical protein
MSKSTPLNQLPSKSQERDIVQDVLDDLEDDMPKEVEYDEMEQQHQDRYNQYQYDQSQISQYKESNPEGYPPQPKGRPEHFQNRSFLESVWEEVKLPLLFVVLFVLLNNSAVKDLLSKYLPENFNSATYVLATKAFVGAILFYLVKSLVLPLL